MSHHRISPKNSDSTPSLVGISVRSINDSENPDFQDESSGPGMHPVSSSLVLNKIQSQPHVANNGPYTSVDDLNREGALLTDEVDLDQVINATEQLSTDEDKHRKLKELKKKKQLQKQKNKMSSSSSNLSISSIASGDSRSLITSTDPMDDQINITSSLEKSHRNRRVPAQVSVHGEPERDEAIRNSYGAFIRNQSHRPHLAAGDSYQSFHENESSFDNAEDERSGRRAHRSVDKKASTDYLRSLSRSLSRDPAKKKQSMATAISADDNKRFYSTNNYSISQADIENAPHIVQETLAEEEEEEGEEGALMNDQGNEEFSQDLQDAALSAEKREARQD
ncbi:hypothetical protein HG535_0A08200 [Zygotorulaspora mrakii]|uniref:Uncharacterized protein n=1 Tax=Zygotorulaspora mrakii TaxID=42260 RepID=A0A7H9AWX7_ZYGMR|nr:uncharacterized protein HG535_0A08200 [Zygotorulaspora mrakii]QLG70875.1 hypothetical protein HG535_0A08200 [Zygotorulaspora mrakii]